MKNAIIFHGSGCNPESYWLPYLKTELEKRGFDVWVPQLPNPNEEKLDEWLPFALEGGKYTDETVLIGHSSGAPLILSILENLSEPIKLAILVAGFSRPISDEPKPILQEKYNWGKIKSNSENFVFINSDNDPWGCDDKQGRYMQERLGGELIIKHDGHMGSSAFNQPYKEFPLLVELVEKNFKPIKTSKEIINYLESIPPEKQNLVLPSGRTIRNLVVHLAGWKLEATDCYIALCEDGTKPWFFGKKDLSEFNKKLDNKYKDLSYKEAVDLLKKSYKGRAFLINKYGKNKLLDAGLGWMFEDNVESHAILHLEQIRKALS